MHFIPVSSHLYFKGKSAVVLVPPSQSPSKPPSRPPTRVPSALTLKSPTLKPIAFPRASDRRCDPRFLPPQPQAKDRQGNQPAYLKEVHVEYLPSPPLLRKVRLLVLNPNLHHSHPPSPSPVPSFHHLQPHHRTTTLLVAAAFLVDHMR